MNFVVIDAHKKITPYLQVDLAASEGFWCDRFERIQMSLVEGGGWAEFGDGPTSILKDSLRASRLR